MLSLFLHELSLHAVVLGLVWSAMLVALSDRLSGACKF
jgi:hypothetical protein